MAEFIRVQYLLGKITPEQVQSLSPQWLTKEEAEKIITLKEEI